MTALAWEPGESAYVRVIGPDGEVKREGWAIKARSRYRFDVAAGRPFWRYWLTFKDRPLAAEEFTSEDTDRIEVVTTARRASLSPMTVSLDTVKTPLLFVTRGETIVSGPYAAEDRDTGKRAVAYANEQLVSLGLEPDATLAEVTQTVSYGKPKVITDDEAVSVDPTPTIDPAGPAAVQSEPGPDVTAPQSAAPVTPPTA